MDQEQASPGISHEQNKPHTDPFSLFGKIAAVVILIAALITAGYFLGKNFSGNNDTPPPKQGEGAPIETPTAAPTVSITTPEASTSAAPKDTQKKITGGLSGSTAFKTYTVSLPSGWTQTKEGDGTVSDKLTISQGAYSVSIYQAAFGGGGCIYPGQPHTEFSQSFSNYIEIVSTTTYRRSWNKPAGSTNSYTFCQKGPDGSFGSITSFGAISAKSPEPADPKIMKDIDVIIASITAQ